MDSFRLLRGVSAGAIAVTFYSSGALAQQSLPTIEVGAAQRRIAPGPAGRPQTAQHAGNGITSTPSPTGPAAAKSLAEDNTTYRPQNSTTALKTNTPIMDTPASIQVVPRAVLNDQQVTEISEAVNNVSGVIAADDRQAGPPSLFIRGFLTNTYYLDGVRMPASPTDTNQNMANVDRVEISEGSCFDPLWPRRTRRSRQSRDEKPT